MRQSMGLGFKREDEFKSNKRCPLTKKRNMKIPNTAKEDESKKENSGCHLQKRDTMAENTIMVR